jgi:hybrid cluster-associated redox disulfide protein
MMIEQKLPVSPAVIADTTISELLDKWPETAVAFQKYNMACVGCVVAPFYTVADAISIYSLDREQFLNELALLMALGLT